MFLLGCFSLFLVAPLSQKGWSAIFRHEADSWVAHTARPYAHAAWEAKAAHATRLAYSYQCAIRASLKPRIG